MAYNILKHRRGTTQEWLEVDLIPEDGELVIEECSDGSRRCKLGDGHSRFSSLPYTDEALQAQLLAKLDGLANSLESKIEASESSLLEQLNSSKQSIEKALVEQTKNLTDDYISRDSKITASLSKSILTGVANLREEVTSDLEQLQDSFDTKLTVVAESVSAESKKDIADIESKMNTAIDNVAAGLVTSIDTLSTDFSKQLTSEANKRDNAVKALIQDIAELGYDIKKASDDLAIANAEAIEALDKEVNDAIEAEVIEREKAYKNLSNDIASVSTALSDSNKKLSSNIASAISASSARDAMLADNLAQETQEREKQDIVLADNIRTVVNLVQDNAEALNAKINTVAKDITATDKQFADKLSAESALREAQIEGISKELHAVTTNVDTAIVELQTSISSVEDKITVVEETLSSSISDEAKKQEQQINRLTNDLSKLADKTSNDISRVSESIQAEKARLVKTDEALNTRILNEITERVTKDELLARDITNLSNTVNNSIKSSISSLDKKISKNLESISVEHKKDIDELSTSVETTCLDLEEKLADQVAATNHQIELAVSELADDFNSRLEASNKSAKDALETLERKQSVKIVNTESALIDKISETSTTLQDKIILLKDELTAADQTLLNNILQLEQQSELIISTTIAQLDTISENVNKLGNVDNTITAMIYDTNNVLTDLSTKLSADIEQLKQRHSTSYSYINDELDKLAIGQSVADAAVLNTLLEYITRFYRELTDLVDDDIIILEKVVSAENSLKDTISELDKRLTASINDLDKNLVSKISTTAETLSAETLKVRTELEENLNATKATLVENIETLRSTSNLKINDNLKAIETLEFSLSEAKSANQERFSDIELESKQLSERIASTVSDYTSLIALANSRIDVANNRLDNQFIRLSNIISLSQGSTTGDAELMDIRNGYNGLYHASAGDAVRAVGEDLEALKASLPDYIPANAVDGLLYEDNLLYLTSDGIPVSDPVEITGGSGGGGGTVSTVKVTNNLPYSSFTVAKGNEVLIDFTYTSYENEVPTGDGNVNIIINNKKIDELSGKVQHGIAKKLEISKHLKNGANSIKVTCTDQYGVSRNLIYNVSVVELKIESTFNSSRIFDGDITFRYKIYGQIEKTVYILLDGEEIYSRKLSASVSGNESTFIIPQQTHGCHKITAYISAIINEIDVRSNILEYEVLCTEIENSEAMLASICDIKSATQGDLITIPYLLYDPSSVEADVNLIVSSQIAGQITEVSRTTLTVNRDQQSWKTRQYPVGQTIFTISYTYDLHGVTKTVTKSHAITIAPLDIDISADTDSLQLYLSAQGRSNREQNPAVWTFKSDKADEPLVTTTFTNLNWSSNGWITDANGDTCLRLNGDARAVVNFKPFAKDFKLEGKTIEFEFAVRDVNSRDTVVIDCFDGQRGFRATPDTAFLKSSGTEVSCRYKDEERIRVAVAVEYADSSSRFVSIYLDGVLSGVQRYADTDSFAQENPLAISLGSSLCGLDIYAIRVYDKALSTPQVLTNFIADKTEPITKLQLMTDNDILQENGKISYDRVKALGQIPIITFTGQMPKYKGDKRKKSVRMKFEDPLHPELNFDVLLDQIDVQGTSSQFYIRKNWKVTLPEARAHILGAIPAKVFCIKVDYAEATGTHNTGSANFVETLYDREEVTLPPQKDDDRVRTTIQGFPCVIFEKSDADAEPVFASKGNFNYDKGAEDTFGFTEAYKSYGVECWEFRNNTSNAVNFAGPIASNWLEDFEPRYVPKSANFKRIEELQEISELAASGKVTMTEAQRQEQAKLMEDCIANFKAMHDWVISTATYTLVDGKKVPIVPTPLVQPVTYGSTTYTEDTEEYRLAKFKYEFTNYFNMHYCSIYYVFTLFALMTDQRAKNLFLTRWKDSDGVYRWYPYFYDNDTIFGINNEGAVVFDYYHEDIDQLGSSNVYNGQNSVFWNNFRICFPQIIQQTYATLRSDNKITYDKIINQYVTQGSDKWSATIYNEDAEYKYVSMAREAIEHTDEEGNIVTELDTSNLYQVRGPGEHHLRYFVANRLNYCDSKWYAGNYPSDDIFLRIYTPSVATITDEMSDEEKAEIEASNARIQASLDVVPANPSITVTPFSNMYAGVRYKSGTLQQQRLTAGNSYTFSPLDPDETFGDTETAIYGASELSSLGDLSGLYCGVISLGKASKLVELKIGHESPYYHNDNFREISVGSNRLLRKIDLRNCSGLGIAGKTPQKTLELSGCPNIEYIYTEGTNLESIALPASGYIKTLHLPASINTLVIKNQQYINDFSIESYKNIRTLCLENCPTLDTDQILAACRQDGKYTVERVRLTGINWQLPDASFIKELFPKFDAEGNFVGGIRGIDDKNNPLDDAYLVGTCYIEKLSGAEYTEIKNHYPYLDIKFGEMTSNINFVYPTDDTGVESIHTISITSRNSETGSCSEPVLDPAPYWPENDAFTYVHKGWSRKKQVSKGVNDKEEDYLSYIHADALYGIAGDRTLYPVFEAIRKSYDVTFVNPTDNNKVLQVVKVPYGSNAVYSAAIPEKLDAASPDLYAFVSWYPAPENIVGELLCYAQFSIIDSKWYTITLSDIEAGFTLRESDKTMTITACHNDFNAAVRVPDDFTISNTAYKVVVLGGFTNHDTLELITLPAELAEISSRAFESCQGLFEVNFPDSLTTIGSNAFHECYKIKAIHIPKNVVSIGDAAFADCKALESISVAEDNKAFVVIDGCLIDTRRGRIIQGLTTASIPQDGTVKEIGGYSFSNTGIVKVTVPEGVETISENAFRRCYELKELSLPSTLKELSATCFAWCTSLANVTLPESIRLIKTYVFNGCAIKDIVIPSSTEELLEHSFGEMPTLETVTFKKRLSDSGEIVPPKIDPKAFNKSGSAEKTITFNMPWSADKTPEAPWGATNYVLNYDYVEEVIPNE